jgi:hypothetical protein
MYFWTAIAAFLKRLLLVVVCLAGSGISMMLAPLALNLAAYKSAPWALFLVGSWFCAFLALVLLSLGWIFNFRFGKAGAFAAGAAGVIGLVSLPLFAGMLASPPSWSEFSAYLVFELLITFSGIYLALKLMRFHSSAGDAGSRKTNEA